MHETKRPERNGKGSWGIVQIVVVCILAAISIATTASVITDKVTWDSYKNTTRENSLAIGELQIRTEGDWRELKTNLSIMKEMISNMTRDIAVLKEKIK